MKIIPNQNRSDASMILEAISEGIQGFIKGQAIIALIMAICVMVAMKILGLNLIIVAVLYVFIAMIIPVVGPIICVIVPLLIAASTSLSLFIILAIILFVLSQIIVNVVQPKVLSKSLGIHPVIVVLAVIIGAQLFGFVGALLALPVASIIQSLLIHYYRYL